MTPRFLNALACKNTGRPPVWLMRQAGRYMPEYRAVRSRHSFLEMVHEPEIAAQVTLLPIKRFGFDAAILFSDILVIAEALGVGLRFDDGIGPIIERPLSHAKDVDKLPAVPDLNQLRYVPEAIKRLLPDLQVPLIGFCGAPFTIASYMIEGKSSKDFRKTKQWMLSDPESFHRLLTVITNWTIEYLKSQIDAGVHALQIFDSWANVLAFPQFKEFSYNYLGKILDALRPYRTPTILFCRGSSVFAPTLAQLNPSGLGIDWNADLAAMRATILPQIALQGNLDPDILYAPLPALRREVQHLLIQTQNDPGYIFNLGHGITPQVPVEAVECLVETIKAFEYGSS